MNGISFLSSFSCKEAISDYRVVKPLIQVADVFRDLALDFFYTLCYFGYPWMRVRPYEIWGRYKQSLSDALEKWPSATHHYYLIHCGDQKFRSRTGKKVCAEEIEHWVNNEVTYANRVRAFTISQGLYKEGKNASSTVTCGTATFDSSKDSYTQEEVQS